MGRPPDRPFCRAKPATCPYARRAARKHHARSSENLAAPFALAQRHLGIAPLLGPKIDASSLGCGHRSGFGGRLFPGASSGPPACPPPADSRAFVLVPLGEIAA